MFEPILNSSVSATRKKTLNLTTYLFALGIIPISIEQSHWYLAVINAKKRVINSLGLVHRDELIIYSLSIIVIYSLYYQFPILSVIQGLILIK